MERLQQKNDAGFVSKQYPDVDRIIVNMIYKQKGVAKPILRTVNFYPSSHALFRIECLTRDCTEGGFDLTKVINSMIRKHRETATGELRCAGAELPSEHANISYDIAIKYV